MSATSSQPSLPTGHTGSTSSTTTTSGGTVSEAVVGNCTVITIDQSSLKDYPRTPVDGKPTLVYWSVWGIVHPIRMALTIANIEWVDIRIICGSTMSETGNKQDWYHVKKQLRQEGVLDFPNVPYYLEHDDDDGNGDDDNSFIRLVQSDAILRYIGRKYGLLGNVTGGIGGGVNRTIVPHIMDMLLDEVTDLDTQLIQCSFKEGPIAVSQWLCSESLQDNLKIWYERYILNNIFNYNDVDNNNESSLFLAGSSTVSIVDLKLYTVLFKMQHACQVLLKLKSEDGTDENNIIIVPTLPSWIPTYLTHVKTSSSQLDDYSDSPAILKIPINNPHYKFDKENVGIY